MYVRKFIRKTYFKYIFIFFPFLITLDGMMTLYDYSANHIITRHIFLRQDLLTCFGNILFWVLLYIPIIIDTIDDLSHLCVGTFVRITSIRYATNKLFSLSVYCFIWFATSFCISFFISILFKYPIIEIDQIISLFVFMIFSSVFLLLFHIFVTWIFMSVHISTILYFCILLILQNCKFENRNLIQIMMAYKEISIAVCIFLIIIIFVLWNFAIRKTDYIGIKKGATI